MKFYLKNLTTLLCVVHRARITCIVEYTPASSFFMPILSVVHWARITSIRANKGLLYRWHGLQAWQAASSYKRADIFARSVINGPYQVISWLTSQIEQIQVGLRFGPSFPTSKTMFYLNPKKNSPSLNTKFFLKQLLICSLQYEALTISKFNERCFSFMKTWSSFTRKLS